MPQKKRSKLVNAKARFDYELKETYLAGLVLSGPEVSSIRAGRVSMRGAYVSFKDGEAWLNNLELSATTTNAQHFPLQDHSRPRKLLLKKRELAEIKKARENSLAVVPTKLLPGRYIKVEIAIGRGKKKYDKRASLKKRDQDREAQRQLKRRR